MIKKILALCFLVFQLQAIDIFQAVEVNDKLAVRQWLKSKPDVHVLNDQGQSLLHVAVQAGNRALVKQLLKKRIDVNLVDHHGKTAMDYAVELQYDNIVLAMVKYNANVSSKENYEYVRSTIKARAKFFALVSLVLYTIASMIWNIGLRIAQPCGIAGLGVVIFIGLCVIPFFIASFCTSFPAMYWYLQKNNYLTTRSKARKMALLGMIPLYCGLGTALLFSSIVVC